MKPRNKEAGRLRTLGRMAMLIGELLDGREHDRKTVAELLDTTPENAARYLDAIRSNLDQVRERPEGRMRKFYVDALSKRPPPARPAAIAACFASSLARLLEPSKYGAAMRDALRYVLEAMPDGAEFADIDRKFVFLRRGGEPALERSPRLLDVVVDALLDGRCIEIDYRRFDAQVTKKAVRPLSIIVHEHQLYLVVYGSKSLPVIYRFSRILSARAQAERFAYPPVSQYDPEVLFRSQFGIIVNDAEPIVEVVVKLAPRWKVYVEGHRWHASQRVTVAEDHVLLRLDVRICDELKRWILGFGADAEVVRPAALRHEIGAALRRAAALYGPPPARPPSRQAQRGRSTGRDEAAPKRSSKAKLPRRAGATAKQPTTQRGSRRSAAARGTRVRKK